MEGADELKEKIMKLDQEDKFMWLILGVILIFLISLVSKFQHIPGPIYGGDLYMIRGFTQAIIQGHSFWQDPYFAGHYAYYGWLSYLVTAILVKITGVGLEKMSIFLPAFVHILFLWACYKFGSIFFKSKKYGLLFMLANFAYILINTKISAGFSTLFMILTLWSWMEFENGKKNFKYLMGLFMGLTALSHIMSFISLSLMIGVTIFIELVRELLNKNKKNKMKIVLKLFKKYLVVGIIALVIAMALVGPWIFVYGMETLNLTQQYSLQNIDNADLGWVFSMIKSLFINTNSIPHFVWGLVGLLGLVFCILNRKKTEQKYVIYWLIAGVIGASHHFITIPLFNNYIVPGHVWGSLFWILYTILFVFGLKNLDLMISKFNIEKQMITAVFVVFMILFAVQGFNKFNTNQWVEYGRTMDSSLRVMFSTEDWMLTNTDKDDVFLANDESAFALNALSGRRVVTARRTHASYYVDVEKRYADAIVMLYGNDKQTVISLLEEYSVDYLYLDSFLISRPMITSLEHEQYLIDNGINYTIQDVRLDPSTTAAPVYTSIVVYPQELRILNYNITQPVKQFSINQQPHSVFYKIF